MKVIGIDRFDYVRKRDNKRVLGMKLYCIDEDITAEGLEGVRCESFFFNDDKIKRSETLEYVEVGSEIRPSYNRFGGVEDIIFIERS